MITLPKDLYAEIAQHVSPQDQLQFRRTSKHFLNLPFNLEQCCAEPTNFEIAKWLIHQSRILSDERTRRLSIFKNTITFYFKDRAPVKNITIKVPTGELFGELSLPMSIKKVNLTTPNEILTFLGNYKLDLRIAGDIMNNWAMVRDIFAQRLSCRTQNISSDWCYIQLLSKFININNTGNWVVDITYLCDYFNDKTCSKLEDDVTESFTKPVKFSISTMYDLDMFVEEFAMSDLEIDFAKLTLWLKRWVSQLTPADIAQHSYINYSNTHYL